MIDDAEKLQISNKKWNEESYIKYEEWKLENDDVDINTLSLKERVPLYKLIVAWCNATEYEEWAVHTFSINEDDLPLMLIYSPKQDGYWIYDDMKDYNDNGDVIIIDDEGKNVKKVTMNRFIDNVFNERIEIKYIRGWIARQAMKLERWLNSLSGFAIAGVFISVFVILCGLMVLLDYCCSPSHVDFKQD